MSHEQLTVLAILGLSLALFVARVRPDLVALLVVLGLAGSGVSTTQAALSGFGNPVVIMLACLLVVGEALARTGVADVVGGWIGRLGRGEEGRTRAAVILASGVLGSCMNSTAVVALFLPVVLRVAQEHRIAPNRLLIPLAYGSLISGMMTLIGTAPNLIVNAELRARGHATLGFFDFTPYGTAVLFAAVACFWFGARWLLPSPPTGRTASRRPRVRDLWAQFVASDDMVRLEVRSGSPLIGRTLRESELGSRFGVRVLAVEGEDRDFLGRPRMQQPSRDTKLGRGDVLVASGTHGSVALAAHELDLAQVPLTARDVARLDRELGVAVVMIRPESELIGKALADTTFRARESLHVAGVRRDGGAVHDYEHTPLRSADSLLVMGDWARIARLQGDPRDFVLLALPAELAYVAPERKRMALALVILCAMVLVSATGLLPMVISALGAAVALVVTRCVPMTDAYRAVHLSSLVLVAGMLALAEALGRTGVLELGVDALTGWLEAASPHVVLGALFLVSTGIGSIVSNSATAALMGPVAISVAEALGHAPQAYAMTVALAASSAYLTPMGSPVNGLVVEPGGYSVGHFFRAGLPLLLATLAITVFGVPLLFPL